MRYQSVILNRFSFGVFVLIAISLAGGAFADPPETINIRGQLLDAQGHALPGLRDYSVQFYDAGAGGAALGSVFLGQTEVSIEGLFNITVTLPPQVILSPQAWYEVAVASGAEPGPLTGTDLFPNRIKVESVPFALESAQALTADLATNAGNADTVDAKHAADFAAASHTQDWGTITGKPSTFPPSGHAHNGADITSGRVGNAYLNTGSGNGLDADLVDAKHAADFAAASHPHNGADITSGKVSNNYLNTGSGNGLDADLVDGSHASAFAISGHNHDTAYWKLGGNADTTAGTNYVGTSDNVALELKVNGARAFRLEPPIGSPNVIGGYSGNSVTSGMFGATIAGGGLSGSLNSVTAHFGTIGGGQGNTASGGACTVSGGSTNTASGGYSVVGGGWYNQASASYATVAGGGPSDTGNPTTTNNKALDDYCTVGGGGRNTAGNGSGAMYGTVAGGSTNTASGTACTVSGGSTNTASVGYSVVGGGWYNQASHFFATVAGGRYNQASARYATVSGGGPSDPTNASTTNNKARGEYCTVGGGGRNTAGNGSGAIYATVGGGQHNTASGNYSTVSGGTANTASGNNSTVSGGSGNTASFYYSTVSGGSVNTASGYYSTVPGGYQNTAAGDYSFAAGYGAKVDAAADGAFVWADRSYADFTCTTANAFWVRASGGACIYSNAGLTAGVQLAAGGGSWTAISDRNAKENFIPVNGSEVLDKVAALPISTWNYKAQDASIRHIGPMAQDVYAAFAVGESDTGITTIDADGVALAAIQGLNQKVEEQAATIAAQASELSDVKARMAKLEALVEQLAAK